MSRHASFNSNLSLGIFTLEILAENGDFFAFIFNMMILYNKTNEDLGAFLVLPTSLHPQVYISYRPIGRKFPVAVVVDDDSHIIIRSPPKSS